MQIIVGRFGGVVFRMQVLFVLVLLPAFSANGQACESSATRHAFHSFAEVSGDRDFVSSVDDRWVLTLRKNQYGWSIRLFDSTGVDLSQMTPPFRASVNHRDIEGWHFRNADNSAANDGSVNAPQELRVFSFSEALTGTGGFKPSSDGTDGIEGSEGEGRGSLRVVDYGLTDLGPGEKARLVYLKFNVCLTWPKSEEEIAVEQEFSNLEYISEEEEIARVCGLGLGYEMDAVLKPRMVSGDFDSDDAGDSVVQVKRIADGRRGLAICRASTWTSLVGFDSPVDAGNRGWVEQLETWRVMTPDEFADNIEGLDVATLPLRGPGSDSDAFEFHGDVLSLERIEKSQHIVYWDGKRFQTQLVFHFVEPDR